MKKNGVLAGLAFLAGIAGSWAYSSYVFVPEGGGGQLRDRTFDRVMKEQTVRCGYTVAPPLLIKDPNTGQLSGMAHDFTEALGQALHLKIDWAEETGWGSFPAALQTGRIDAFCTGAWSNAARARETDATIPFAYQLYYAFVRAGDTRFDNNLDAVNDPTVTVSVIDGDTSNLIARSAFPKAKTVQLPEMSGVDELFINVMSGKADITFIDASFAAGFEVNNPGKMRRVTAKTPLRVFGNVLFVAQGQDTFRRMLDTATEELLSSGQVEKIIKRYEKFPGAFLRAAPGYEVES